MRQPSIRLSALILAAAGLIPTISATQASAELISIRSGQVSGLPGVAGQADDTVRFLNNNPPGAPISAGPFTPADFSGALTGAAATVIDPVGPWVANLSDTSARWVNFSMMPGNTFGTSGSCLYAVPFFVSTLGATGGNLNLEFAVDDAGGDALYGGANPSFLYVNGVATGYAGGGYSPATFHSQFIPFSQGWNTIYLYQRDQGLGVSGIIFSLTIDVIPSPAAASLLGMGALLTTRRRR